MTNDFLNKVAKDADKAIKANDSSPYRLNQLLLSHYSTPGTVIQMNFF